MPRRKRNTRAKPRGRTSLIGLPVLTANTLASTSPSTNRRTSSLRNATALSIGTPSEMTSQTPLDTPSLSGYSTPGTSNAPSPPSATADNARGKKSRFAVEIPIVTLKHETDSMQKRKRDVISDSDDEALSDGSLSSRVARELQEEEYRLADEEVGRQVSVNIPGPRQRVVTTSSLPASHGPSLRRSARNKKSTSTNNTNSASDAETDDDLVVVLPPDCKVPAAKRRRTVVSDTDSDDTDSDDDSEVSSPGPKRKPKRVAKPASRTAGSAPKKFVVDSDESISIASDSTGILEEVDIGSDSTELLEESDEEESSNPPRISERRRAYRRNSPSRRQKNDRDKLEKNHPSIKTMWDTLEQRPQLKLLAGKAEQPKNISRSLKPFQLEGLAWMMAMEKTDWKGGLLGDEMGLGKTIQAVSLIMSDFPAKNPTIVLVPPVALMQWSTEIASYTDGTLNTFVFHGTNAKAKKMTMAQLRKYHVIMMSYNSLESIYRKQEKGFTRKDGIYKEKSVMHQIRFHRVILDEAHCIKTRTTMTAKACFALKADYRWCLTGTPLQNRIGEFFSLVRFLNIRPFAEYLCRQCPCSTLEWNMDDDAKCSACGCAGMQHVSLFNQELLNPIQRYGQFGPGAQAFDKLRLMTDRIMLRRLKKDHTDSMELPVKEIYVDRQFFGEEENDFASSIMTSGKRKFNTYVSQGVLLNNYANIFGLIMKMRQVADHPDLILKRNSEEGQNVLVCCICDEPAEDAIKSQCKHEFCRACASSYLKATSEPDCPRCHISLMIDLDQPEIEQDESMVKKSSIINRIKMENWTSSSKIELLVHELHKLRSDNASHKSIIFSQFTTMLQLIEWRLHRAGITTVMLDGSMTPAQRQASINHFMKNAEVECFLVSLRAGGVALNLTEASRVFIVDPWWNPAAEWQSADRCHRIGQTRPCIITRLCIEDSVESRMVLIQEKKTSMIHSTVNADDKAIEALTPEDLQFLFRGH